jgi:hypothetical protein
MRLVCLRKFVTCRKEIAIDKLQSDAVNLISLFPLVFYQHYTAHFISNFEHVLYCTHLHLFSSFLKKKIEIKLISLKERHSLNLFLFLPDGD